MPYVINEEETELSHTGGSIPTATCALHLGHEGNRNSGSQVARRSLRPIEIIGNTQLRVFGLHGAYLARRTPCGRGFTRSVAGKVTRRSMTSHSDTVEAVKTAKQDQLLDYWDELDEQGKGQLVAQLKVCIDHRCSFCAMH